MLIRFAYLAVTHAFAALRLLPMTDHDKDIELLALRHQLTVLQRQLGDQRPQLRPEDRAFLAALLVPLALWVPENSVTIADVGVPSEFALGVAAGLNAFKKYGSVVDVFTS